MATAQPGVVAVIPSAANRASTRDAPPGLADAAGIVARVVAGVGIAVWAAVVGGSLVGVRFACGANVARVAVLGLALVGDVEHEANARANPASQANADRIVIL